MKIHAFYGAQYLGNETSIDDLKTIPDGAYIHMAKVWYSMTNNSLVRMDKVDLPPEVKAQVTLLGL